MKITVHQVILSRDAMSQIAMQVWPWELPVLESKYPDGLVQKVKDLLTERDELPDAEREFVRLEGVHGVDPDTKQSHVKLAYGHGAAGLKMLKQAIVAAEYREASEKAKAPNDPLK